MEKTNNKKLAASAVLIVASLTLLLGLTFAWFTDTVTNKGNKIQAGTLGITATAASLGSGGATVDDPENATGHQGELNFGAAESIEGEAAPIISEAQWEPGQSNAKLLTVENSGALAVKVKLQFDVSDGGLEGALWYDFVQVKGGVVAGQLERRPMGSLGAHASGLEFPIEAGQSISFILLYGMDEAAGNEYQGKSFEAAVSIVAAQAPVETDGFGNADYDADAAYPTVVSTADDFIAALTDGGIVQLSEDIVLADQQTIAADTTIDLQGRILTIGDGTQSIKAAANTTLTIEGDGAINGVVYADKNGSVVIEAGDGFNVSSASSMGYAVYGGMGSSIVVNGGTYRAETKGAAGVINSLGSSLVVRGATVNVGVASVMSSAGIYSNATHTTLEDVTVNANYGIAVDLKNASGSTVIKGGTFVTDKEADGFASPTIRYQGTLDISDASITRVSTGIVFSKAVYPKPTEPEGLTYSNLTFIQAHGATGNDIGV